MTVQTVTGETLEAFHAERLDLAPPEAEKPKPAKAEGENEADEQEAAAEGEQPPAKPKGINGRFSELTEQRRKAEERAAAAERERDELRAKLNPKPVEEAIATEAVGPKPDPKDYPDAFKFAADLAEWSANKALHDRDKADAEKAAKAEQEKVVTAFSERVKAAKEALPDYDEKLAASEVSVSDAVRDAIIESEHGPKILYALADDPALAKKLGGMSVLQQLVEIGKMTAKFDTPAEAAREPQPEPEKPRPRAPAPITPVKGGKLADNPVTSSGEFKGTFQEWKAARRAMAQH